MGFPQTLEQAMKLFQLNQQLQEASSPEELLRAFVAPIWAEGNCNAVLGYIDRQTGHVEDWIVEILASITTDDSIGQITPTGSRYSFLEYPLLNTYITSPEAVLLYDLNTPDHPFNETILNYFRQQKIQVVGVILLRKPDDYVVGAVVMRWTKTHSFHEDEKQLLTALVPGMATIVDNLWLLSQRERTLELTDALYKANQKLLVADGYDQILDAVFEYASETDANVASMLSIETDEAGYPEWGTIVARAGVEVGVGSPAGSRFYLPAIPFAKVWIDAAGSVLFVEDSMSDPRYDAVSRVAAQRVGIRATVIMPLHLNGVWIGMLNMNWAEPHQFTSVDKQFYRALSTQIAAVLEGHRLRSVQLRAMEQLAHQEAHYRLLADNATDMISVNAPDGIFTYVSPSSETLLGYTPAQLVGKSPYEFVHPEDIDKLREAQMRNPEAHISLRQFRMRRQNGEYIWLESVSRTVHDAQGEVLEAVSVTRDISKRKEAEDAAARLNHELIIKAAQLEEANKELEAFTYSVSHDLRAPLRAMDGFSKILSEKYRDQIPQDGARYLDRVQSNARQMGLLIDDLLKLSRVGKRPLDTRTCDVRKVVETVFQELSESGDTDKVQFILDDLPPCHGDSGLIKQVFVNLLSNAVKFSRNCSEPVIEVGADDKTQGSIIYFVRDNGVGFDMEYSEKVFGVFQRLHDASQYEGTGVGLAIVNRIIQRHGGRIWVDSAPNAGTTFYFTLEGERNARSAR